MQNNDYAIKIRNNFPIFKQFSNGFPLCYLDNAASSHMPYSTINLLVDYYSNFHSNIHRGVYNLSEISTQAHQNTRLKVQKFINAKSPNECIFTSGTTESKNLLASCFADTYINKDDEILISAMEHHSNLVPWKIICDKNNARLRIIPIKKNGKLNLENINKIFNKKVKLFSIIYVSNSIGTINPIKWLVKKAKEKNIVTIIDASQAASSFFIDVQNLNCDFFLFSAHKLYGPTGVGILYGKKFFLGNLPPYKFGGNMVNKVSFTNVVFNKIPYKFEAGTPNISNIISFGSTIDFLNFLNYNVILKHKQELIYYTIRHFNNIKHIRIIGLNFDKINIISFILLEIHAHDVGEILNQYGISIRTGHHCAMPVNSYYNVPAINRISLGIYSTYYEIDQLLIALRKIINIFKR